MEFADLSTASATPAPGARTIRNIIWSMVSYIWPMFFAFFITPVIIFSLGTHTFGVYTFILSIISIIGLVDLGAGLATQRQFTNYHSTHEHGRLRALIGSMNLIFIAIGITGFLIFFVLALTANSLSFATQWSDSLQLPFLIAGIMFCINAVGTLPSVALYALQRFDVTTKIGMIKIIIQNSALLLTALLTKNIVWVLAILTLIDFIFVCITFVVANRFSPLPLMRIGWNAQEVVKIYKFGLVATLNNVSNSVLTHFDRLIIPAVLGPAALTYYSVPGNAAAKITGTINNVGSVIFPLSTELSAGQHTSVLTSVYIRTIRFTIVMAVCLATPLIFLAAPILSYWLDASFAEQSSTVLQLLTCTSVILAIFQILSSFMLGMGNVGSVTKTSAFMAVLNLIFLLLLLSPLGITGAALSYLLSTIPIIWLWVAVERTIGEGKRLRANIVSIVKSVICSLAAGSIAHLLFVDRIDSLFMAFVASALTCILFLALYWIGRFDSHNDFTYVWSYVRNRLRKN